MSGELNLSMETGVTLRKRGEYLTVALILNEEIT